MANHRRVGLPWRKDPEVLARLPEVGRRMLRRETHQQIATALGSTISTVHQDMKRVRELWVETIQDEQTAMRAQIVAELDDARLEALRAAEWDYQCERAVLFGQALVEDDPILGRCDRQVWRDTKGSAQFRGNKAAAIGQARQATMDKAKVLGLIVDKVAPTDADGKTLSLAEIRAAMGIGEAS